MGIIIVLLKITAHKIFNRYTLIGALQIGFKTTISNEKQKTSLQTTR